MKYRTSQKEIKANFGVVVSCGYCDLQNLFNYENAESYTCGVYGWNADIYSFGGTAIVTGYRPFGKRLDYDKVREFDKKAEHIRYDSSIPYEDRKPMIDELVEEFIQWVRENY